VNPVSSAAMPYYLHIGLAFLGGGALAAILTHLLRRQHIRRSDADPPAPRKSPEPALSQRLKFFETIATQAAESIIVTNTDEHILYVNPAFTQLHGYTPDDVLGRTPAFLLDTSENTEGAASSQEPPDRTSPGNGNLIHQTRDGKRVILETVIAPVRDDSGTSIGSVIVGRDITYQTQLETQLRHAQKMEAIGTLAGGIAHDFNNILSAIIGYTELAILDDEDQMPVRGSLDQILKAAKRAADLISQILSFSRRNTHARQALYLKPILAEALKLLRGTLPSSIEITSNFDQDAPPILADATQMHQIIMNLCTNAAYAMQHKGGTLSITLRKLDPTAARPAWQAELPTSIPYLQLTIADTGHGMPPEVLARIFEPYFTTKCGGDGTGLGLATVQGIVKAHAGIIHAESDVDQGSAFHIVLPACSAGHVFPGNDPKEPDIPRGNKEKILVVDDEESLTMMISTALTYLGYDVEAYTSSVKALNAFVAAPSAYDCIISDQTMPTLSGADFARRVLAIRPDLPFILCSGYTEMVNAESAREIGIAEFVLKPATGRSLAAIVDKLLHA